MSYPFLGAVSIIEDESLGYFKALKQSRKFLGSEKKYLYYSMEAITWICDYLWQVKSKTRRDCVAIESLSTTEPLVPLSCDDDD